MNHICIPKSGDEQMNKIKRLRARSCLYRSRFLRVSTYVAIFFEIIFMIYALLHLPNLNMSAEYDNLLDKKLTNICQNLPNSFKICQTLAKTSPTFWKTFDTFDILEYIRLYSAHLIELMIFDVFIFDICSKADVWSNSDNLNYFLRLFFLPSLSSSFLFSAFLFFLFFVRIGRRTP